MPALLDARELEADTVMVSISVVSRSENSHQWSDVGEPYQPLENSVVPQQPEPSQPDRQRGTSPMPAAAPLRPTPQQIVVAQAEAVSATEPTVEQPLEHARIKTDSVAEPSESSPSAEARPDQQSAEIEANRSRQVIAEERYLTELLNAIAKHRFYPANARKKGQQGRVEINLTILKNGEFKSIAVSKPSDHRTLNIASTRTLNLLKRFKPFPTDIDREFWQISIPFRYVLNGRQDNRS